MSTSVYKLTYFNLRARAEVTRLLFHYAGQEFEDHRVSQEDWVKIKPTTPFGHIPMLTVDGHQLGQSLAIARYVARQFGLAGSSPMEHSEVDAYVDLMLDVFAQLRPLIYEEHEEDERKVILDGVMEKVPALLEPFERRLKNHDYLVGKVATWADINLMYWMTCPFMAKALPAEFLATYKKINEHNKRVMELPRIKEYLANRPVTPI